MRRSFERLRHKMKRVPKTLLSGTLLCTFLFGFFSVMLTFEAQAAEEALPRTVSHTLLTTVRAEDEVVPVAGVAVTANDEIVYTAYNRDGSNILDSRTFPVTVMADGGQHTVEIIKGTVGDALEELELELGEHDVVQPALGTELSRSVDEILVQRVEYAERVTRTEVLSDEVEAYKAKIAPQDFTTSKSRIYDVTYKDTVVDGIVTESEILSLEAIYHPYDPPSPAFEPGVPVSTIDSFVGVELDENGIPVNYSRKISNAVCTAYSAARGRGAGGQGLYCGTVAVNPNVIPYGTRLYITASNGSFVYGYAIASDCGTAMMEGYVDIDLYFETNAECRKFGKRSLDVYILD